MKTIALLTLLLVPLASWGALPIVRFDLPGTPLEVATQEGIFVPFAEKVGIEVERLLGDPASIDDPATLRLLLATRVHLAHYRADNERAVATAAWIRSLQTDPAARAFAGLTTFAAVEARRRHPGASAEQTVFRTTFLSEFERQLAALPNTPAMVTFLKTQKQKIEEVTETALLREVREVIIPAIQRQGHCGLAEADQLVRVRHRLRSILPLRGETIVALERAIAAR
ncbi:MAG TPA: hypothetical protein PLN52_24440 [Opitutaceae bacterium]|nr:hypothetical protein [Opitutaceae bacterium]